MSTYAITATASREDDGWRSTRQIPTFYLDGNVQGIVSEEHAAEIATEIIDPFRAGQVVVSAVAQ